LYADNGALVENTTDAEAPLLASYDGIEYASCERPSKMLQGRASFKLKISQVPILYVKCYLWHSLCEEFFSSLELVGNFFVFMENTVVNTVSPLICFYPLE
jgi:hypothetical protein